MDSFDLGILACLEEDGRQSFAAIADQVSLSKTPCWTRVQILEAHAQIEHHALITTARSNIETHKQRIRVSTHAIKQ